LELDVLAGDILFIQTRNAGGDCCWYARSIEKVAE
jgi:hypothetical protein